MHLKSFTVLALSAVGAVAHAEEKRQIVPTDSQGISVLSVLATAIPSSLVSLALTNPAALSSELASSISAGNIPSWYQALPSDVKSYLPKLYPASTAASATASATASAASTDSAIASISASVSSVQASISASISSALNTTTIASVSSATLASTRGANSASGSASSTGGASYPTAVVGAGVAGAIGFLGMLAM